MHALTTRYQAGLLYIPDLWSMHNRSGFIGVHHVKARLSVYDRKLYRHRLHDHGGRESDTGFGDGCEDGREGAARGGITCPAGGLMEAYDTGGTEGEGREGGWIIQIRGKGGVETSCKVWQSG